MSDFTDKHPHNAPRYNLPSKCSFCYGLIHYRIEHLTGMFPKWIALIQYELDRKLCTGVLYTEAYMFADGESYLWINTTPLFDNLKEEFPRSLPVQIRNRFPHLDQMTKAMSDYCDLNLDFNFKGHFGIQTYRTNSYFRLKVSEPNSYTMSQNTAAAVQALFSFVIKAEQEFQIYKKSNIYKFVVDHVTKAKRAAMPATTLYDLYRIARLGFSLYNGVSDNSSDSSTADFSYLDNNSFGNENLPSDVMVDYLCEDTESTDNGFNELYTINDISFTGNGDKYTDNAYNQSQYDKWMDIYMQKLAKGDTSGANAALSTAKDHLRRIKN